MTALIVTIFLASVMGSLHCAGMCGAFVALAMGTGEQRGFRHAAVQSAYHGGRLLTYSLLGAVAGALGAGLDLTGAVFGVQRVALAVAGGAMIVFGIATLLRLQGVRWRAPKLPAPLVRLVGRGHRFAVDRPPIVRALIIGLLSTFLPCGWLYAFALAAAGTGSASLGAMSMAVFWLGTLPVLISIGLGVQRLVGPLRRHVPAAAAIAIVVVGVLAIGGRFRVPALAVPAAWAEDGATGVQAAVEHVHAIDVDGLPCCRGSE